MYNCDRGGRDGKGGVGYFEKLFIVMEEVRMEEVINMVNFCVLEEMNELLCKLYICEEVLIMLN